MASVVVIGAGTADRVTTAYANNLERVKSEFKKKGLAFPPKRVFFRGIKDEKKLELWVAPSGTGKYKLFKAYTVAKDSGGPGPKRRLGDLQVPEGFYVIDRFNPLSNFHLSLGLNYPNASDRIRSDQKNPGADIFIHGNKVSIGCLAMTDAVIEEIYLLANEAKKAGHKSIPVHIFPSRLTTVGLKKLSKEHPEHAAFWSELAPVYQFFEKNHQLPKVTVGKDGAYVVRQ